MDCNLDDINEESGIILKTTEKITPKKAKGNAFYEWIRKKYKTIKRNEARCALSIINSIAYQKRGVFGLTKYFVKDIFLKDPNWKDELKWEPHTYRSALKILFDKGFIEKIPYETKLKFAHLNIYKVTMSDMIQNLSLDIDGQIDDTIKFAQRKKTHWTRKKKTDVKDSIFPIGFEE